MALRQIRVGAHKDVFKYDDGDFAAADEVWKTNGHASLPDNVLMIGV